MSATGISGSCVILEVTFLHSEQNASEAYGGKEQLLVEHSGVRTEDAVLEFPSSTPLYKELLIDGSTPSMLALIGG